MTAVFKREFRALFNCMRGYSVLALLLLFAGALIVYYGFLMESISLAYVLSDLMPLSAILCPILSYKLFSENQDRLLRILPISTVEGVMGKYLAVMSLYAIQTAVLAVAPLIYNYFAKVDLLESYVSLLAYFLFIASVAAVCMFFSILASKPSLIFAACYGYSVFMYIVQVVSYFVEKQNILFGILSEILNFVGVFNRFESFVYGAFDIGAIAYYLSITFVFIFLTVRSFEKRLGGEAI
jgi:ABC-2 type transport system permease protein